MSNAGYVIVPPNDDTAYALYNIIRHYLCTNVLFVEYSGKNDASIRTPYTVTSSPFLIESKLPCSIAGKGITCVANYLESAKVAVYAIPVYGLRTSLVYRVYNITY